MEFEELTIEEERIAKDIVNAAFKVHKALGPGLLEKIYEICLTHELRKVGYSAQRQVEVPFKYDGITFKEGLRIDILVEDCVIVETKAVDHLNALWQAQVMSHLKLTGHRLGFLINFNVPVIRQGIKRIIV